MDCLYKKNVFKVGYFLKILHSWGNFLGARRNTVHKDCYNVGLIFTIQVCKDLQEFSLKSSWEESKEKRYDSTPKN